VAETRTKQRKSLVDLSSPSSEPFRTLRLALQLRSSARSGNTIVFTSAEPADGKSTIAANFALVSSMMNNVLLIDGDLRQPVVHDIFGIPRAPGLVEALATGSPNESLIQSVDAPGHLDVLTAGRPIPQSADLSSSKRMGEVLQQASENYELVVIDSPPVLHAADAAGLASHGSTEVVLVATRTSRRRTIVKALRELELIEAHIAGIVVNRDGRLAAYGY
jgi:capsular exopolysaccharide synthesis family protein